MENIDFEKIEAWLRSLGAIYYRVLDGQNKKLLGRTLSGPEDVLQHFKDNVELLPDGKYILEASDSPSNSRGKAFMSFEKGGGIKGLNNYKGMDIEAMLLKAKEEGRNEARWEMMVEKVNKLEAKVEKLQQAIIDLITTGDEDGNGILDKVEEAASAAELFKDKFKDFKL